MLLLHPATLTNGARADRNNRYRKLVPEETDFFEPEDLYAIYPLAQRPQDFQPERPQLYSDGIPRQGLGFVDLTKLPEAYRKWLDLNAVRTSFPTPTCAHGADGCSLKYRAQDVWLEPPSGRWPVPEPVPEEAA